MRGAGRACTARLLTGCRPSAPSCPPAWVGGEGACRRHAAAHVSYRQWWPARSAPRHKPQLSFSHSQASVLLLAMAWAGPPRTGLATPGAPSTALRPQQHLAATPQRFRSSSATLAARGARRCAAPPPPAALLWEGPAYNKYRRVSGGGVGGFAGVKLASASAAGGSARGPPRPPRAHQRHLPPPLCC